MTRRTLPWVGLALGLTAAWVGFVQPPAHEAVTSRGEVPVAGPPSATPPPVPARAAPPARLRLPALGVDAPVVPVDVQPDRALAVPDDPTVVGWWRAGPQPGALAGSVVLDGHVDTRADGPGALFRLADLRPGHPVIVETAAGEVSYVVRAVRRYPKAELPAEVFDTAGAPRLVLITCGGAFDRRTRHYADNVVVYAVPAGSRP